MKATAFLMAGLLLLGSAPGWALGLTDVSASIVTPNGDGFNDQIQFVLDNPTASSVEGRLYDMNGREVATLGLSSTGTVTTLVWDGRSFGGGRLESGVYLYQITDGDARINGVVALAR